MAEKDPREITDVSDLQRGKQEAITFATRAPHDKDLGNIWITYTKASDTTMTLYVRHPVTGTWRSATLS